MGRGRPKKDKFEDLPEEFKNQINSSDRDAIKKIVAKVACDQVELMKAKKEDQQLEEAKLAYQDAGAVYKEGTKLNRTKIEYCKAVIDAKGG